ncbi:MAG: hypothetical protein WCE30_08070 [Mycobacterium sp.]
MDTDMDAGWHPTGLRPLRDPLSLGFQAHRQLMLLRLRWHGRRASAGDVGADSDA